MLENDRTQEREDRHHITQEDFTPKSVAETMVGMTGPVLTDFTKTVLDNSCGIGNLLCEVLSRRLAHCTSAEDAIRAVSTLYGVELMADNVEECRTRLYSLATSAFPSICGNALMDRELKSIVKNRIQWCDSLAFDYDRWPEITEWTDEDEKLGFTEAETPEDTKYPMWHKERKSLELTLFQ